MHPARYIHSLSQTGQLLGGRGETSVREMIKNGDLETIVIGGRRYVTDQSIQALIERARLEQAGKDVKASETSGSRFDAHRASRAA